VSWKRLHFQQIAVRIDEKGLVSALKDVSGPSPATIDPRRVPQRKILHDAGQGDFTDLQGEMDVVGHAAEGMDAETEPLRSFLKEKIEATAVGLSEEDGIAGVAAQDDVGEGAR
jgi:hypothetical protein